VKEILFQGADYNAYIHLRGGAITELDSFRTRLNYVNVMDGKGSRKPCFGDHISEKGQFGPDLGSFSHSLYSHIESDKPSHIVSLAREGWSEIGGRRRNLVIRKAYGFRKGTISLRYEVENKDGETASLRLAVEINLAAGFDTETIALFGLKARENIPLQTASICEAEGLDGFRIENLRQSESIEIRSDEKIALRHEPVFSEVKAISCISGGRQYQGCTLLLGIDLDIPADSSRHFNIALELRN
jgi:hypothetical protein